MKVSPGATDVTTYFKLVDPTTGVPETGLTITDLDMSYVRDGAAAVKADATALAAVDSAHGDSKMIQVDATNTPGLYRADWPDAAFAAGVSRVQLCINGAAIDPAYIEVELEAYAVNLTQILGTALTETAGGYVAAAFIKLFDVETPLLMTDTAMRSTSESRLQLTAIPGSLNRICHVFIADSTSASGAGKTGLAFGDVTGYYMRPDKNAATAMTMMDITTLGTYAPDTSAKCAFKEVDSTNMPGTYEVQLPDNVIAQGADNAVVMLRATGAVPAVIVIDFDKHKQAFLR